MNTLVMNTVLNLIDLHLEQYPQAATVPPIDGAFPVLETLSSGDYVLTRTAPDGTVFQAIIDKHTGDFTDTARPNPNPNPHPTNG